MSASVLPELWRTFRARPARPPINWHKIRSIVALMVSAGALFWTGGMLIGGPDYKLGASMLAVGVALLILASQVEW